MLLGGVLPGATRPHPVRTHQCINALKSATNAATAEIAMTGALAKLGIEPVSNKTASEFKAYIAAKVKEGAELLAEAGLKPE